MTVKMAAAAAEFLRLSAEISNSGTLPQVENEVHALRRAIDMELRSCCNPEFLRGLQTAYDAALDRREALWREGSRNGASGDPRR